MWQPKCTSECWQKSKSENSEIIKSEQNIKNAYNIGFREREFFWRSFHFPFGKQRRLCEHFHFVLYSRSRGRSQMGEKRRTIPLLGDRKKLSDFTTQCRSNVHLQKKNIVINKLKRMDEIIGSSFVFGFRCV